MVMTQYIIEKRLNDDYDGSDDDQNRESYDPREEVPVSWTGH